MNRTAVLASALMLTGCAPVAVAAPPGLAEPIQKPIDERPWRKERPE